MVFKFRASSAGQLRLKREAFKFLLKNDDLYERARKLFLTDSFNGLPGIGAIWLDGGEASLTAFIEKMERLREMGRYDHFQANFLDSAKNYVAFTVDPGAQQLEELLEMNESQKNWWETLVTQHREAGADCDFSELFEAFKHFNSRLQDKDINVKLPHSCPMTGIKNMKVALDRVLLVLRAANYPQEQILNLENLDWGPEGAALAIVQGYKSVRQEMELHYTNEPEPSINYILNASKLRSIARTKTNDELKIAFYRFLGQQKDAFPLDDYEKMVKHIDVLLGIGADSDFVMVQALSAEKRLLYILAMVMTGPNAWKSSTPFEEWKTFIYSIQLWDMDVLEARKGEKRDLLSMIVLDLRLDTFVGDKRPDCKTLTDMIRNGIFLAKTQYESTYQYRINNGLSVEGLLLEQDRFLDFLELANPAITAYGNSFFICLERWRVRESVATNPNVPKPNSNPNIESLDFSLLLNRFTRDEIKNINGLTEDQQKFIPRLIEIIILLDWKLSKDYDNREENFRVQLLDLRASFLNLEPVENAQYLLDVLDEIDVTKSLKLPTIDEIKAIIANLNGQAKSREEIKKIVEDFLPDTRIGKTPIQETSMDMLTIVHSYAEKWNAALNSNQFNEFPISFVINNIKPALEHFIASVNGNKSLPEILDSLTELDKKFREALNTNVPGVQALLEQNLHFVYKFLTDKDDFNDDIKNAFSAAKTPFVFIKKELEASFVSEFEATIKSLQTGSDDLSNFIKDQLGGIQLEEGIYLGKSIDEYSIRVDQVSKFLNALVQIKNKDELDFRNFIERKYFIPNDEFKLNIGQQGRLISILCQHRTLQISTSLPILYELIQKQEAFTSQQYDAALSQLEKLMTYQDRLKNDSFLAFLKFSFNYSLTSNAPFPTEKLINLGNTALLESMAALLIKSPQNLQTKLQDTLSLLSKKATAYDVKEVPKLNALFDLMLNALLKCPENLMEQKLNSILECLNNIPDNRLDLVKIVTEVAMSKRFKDETDASVGDINALLKAVTKFEDAELQKILPCLSYHPVPTPREIFTWSNDKENLSTYIQQFEADPWGKCKPVSIDPEAKELSELFKINTRRVASVINKIHPLSIQKKEMLAESFTYINDLRKIEYEGESINLLTCSRDVLKNVFQSLKDQIRTNKNNKELLKKYQLDLLAVVRIAYFRATGKLPNSTQMIAVINSLDSTKLLMQINTGEGKSIITALLSVMQWALDGRVDVCTANGALAYQDYEGKGNRHFFDSLGIPSSIIESNYPIKAYQVDGINYSTLEILSLLRSSAAIEGIEIPLDGALIIDEFDYAALDNRTLFKYAMSNNLEHPEINEYAWIYPLIYRFVETDDFLLNPSDQIKRLKNFVEKEQPSTEQKIQFFDVSNDQLKKWLIAACKAHAMEKETDYRPVLEKNVVNGFEVMRYRIVPLDAADKSEKRGSSYGESIQQFLAVKEQLDEKNRGKEFIIEPELLTVAVESARNFIGNYKGQKKGVTGTLGQRLELEEFHKNFEFESLIIPPHQKSNRKDLGMTIAKTNKAYYEKLESFLSTAKKDNAGNIQPILYLCKDNKAVSELAERLRKCKRFKKGDLRIIEIKGSETVEELQIIMETEACQPNTIIIGTSLLGRGTDIMPKHPAGLLAVQTYLDIERTTTQGKGRLRAKGYYAEVYREEELKNNGFDISGLDHNQAVKLIRAEMNKHAAIERYYVQSIDLIFNTGLSYFHEWQKWLIGLCPEDERQEIWKALLQSRSEFIETMEELWKEILENSDPKHQYINPYVRIDKNGFLERETLDQCLIDFKKGVIEAWENTKQQHLIPKVSKYLNIEGDAIERLKAEHVDERYRQYCGLNFKNLSNDLFQDKEYIRQKKEKVGSIKSEKLMVEAALDPHAVQLKFNPIEEGPEKENLIEESKAYRYRILFDYFIKIIDKAKFPEDKKNALKVFMEPNKENVDFIILAQGIDQYLEYSTQFLKKDSVEAFQVNALIQCLFKTPGVDSNNEHIKKLEHYFINDIIAQIRRELSWVDEGGLFFYLENPVIRAAASELLFSLNKIEQLPKNEVKILALYELLYKETLKTERAFSFSLGHKRFLDVMNTHLYSLTCLNETFIGSDQQVLDAEAERALVEVSLEKAKILFGKTGDRIKKDFPGKPGVLLNPEQKEWRGIIQALNKIQEEQKSIFVIQEMKIYLESKVETQSLLKSYLKDLIQNLGKLNQEIIFEYSPSSLITYEHLIDVSEIQLREFMGKDWKVQLEKSFDGKLYLKLIHDNPDLSEEDIKKLKKLELDEGIIQAPSAPIVEALPVEHQQKRASVTIKKSFDPQEGQKDFFGFFNKIHAGDVGDAKTQVKVIK